MRRLLVAFLFASACSESEPPTSDAGLPPRPDATTTPDAGHRDAEVQDARPLQDLALITETYCAPLAEAMCAQARQCACDALPAWPDAAACEARNERVCAEIFEGAEAGLASGMLRTSQAALQRCLQRTLRSQSPCDHLEARRRLSLCLDILYEDVALGEACAFPSCAGGDGECLSGTCVALPTEGLVCPSACAPGLVCRAGTCAPPSPYLGPCETHLHCAGRLRCIDAVCVEIGAVGAQCVDEQGCHAGLLCSEGRCRSAPIAGCDYREDCGNRGACVVSVETICRPTVAQGIRCTSDSMCRGTQYCDGLTEICTLAPADGQPCGNGTRCRAGSGCGFGSGDCAPLPMGGQACAVGLTGPSLCADGLGCTDGSCGPLPGQGQPCTVDGRCDGDLGCDFTTGGLCTPRHGLGDDCTSNYICGDGLFCDYGVRQCTPVKDTGEPCASGIECGAQACVPDENRNFTCGPSPRPTEPCFFECVAGAYCGPDRDDSYCITPICSQAL